LSELKDPLSRGAAWVTLWEETLDGRVQPMEFLELALEAMPKEDTEQNVQLILGFIDDAFWRFLPDSRRQEIAPRLERALQAGLNHAQSSSLKSAYFSALRVVMTTAASAAFVRRVWQHQETIPGLVLAEEDESAMALDLAVRSVPGSSGILQEQLRRFQNPDRRARFEFVMPALSENQEVRDAWFDRLADVSYRRREPWVVEGLRYLNHPLRAASSQKYVRRGLEMLEDIQKTGDIFFPRNWLDALLNGHNTAVVAVTVRTFLAERSGYPESLRRQILQSADDLFRAGRTKQG
jgi:aminopeptidase N